MKNNKRGQVTVFIIIAIVIVVLAMIIYSFYPQIKARFSFDSENPESYIQNCVEEEFNLLVDKISRQGGSLEPEFFYLYKGEKLNYLCYTEENYQLCNVQKPFLREDIEEELNNAIKPKVDECFDSLREKYISKGFSVELKKGDIKTELLPGRVFSTFHAYELSVNKGEDSNRYNSFNIFLNNNLYELVSIATNMVKWETTIGEADIYNYNLLYNGMKFEKFEQSDGTKVYILTNKGQENKFQFASRSLAFPPGL